MKFKKYLFCFTLALINISPLPAQSHLPREVHQATASEAEIVSFSESTSFDLALAVLKDLSKKFLGKVIVDPEHRTMPIGVDIYRMHWLNGFEIILRKNNLWYQEYGDFIQITSLGDKDESTEQQAVEAKQKFNTREVVITALFFEADVSKLREAGTSWKLFRGKDVNVGATASAADEVGGLFELDFAPDLNFGQISGIFKAMESDQIGEIISSPKITVRSGQEGRIQVGSDVSIVLKDFSGNAITEFFSTGSIIQVTPEVAKYDSVDFIHLNLEIERSNRVTGGAGLEIKKSSARTSIYLLDGEETIIGGLYVNQESTTRKGVPFLKDLPWWFFGLKYVFGHHSKNIIKKELIILLKAELLPSLQDRFNKRKNGQLNNLLQSERIKRRERLKFYKTQTKN